MKARLQPLFAVVATFGLSLAVACSTRPEVIAGGAQLQLEALPAHTTDPRQCALVLYTRGNTPHRIGLALDNPAMLLLHSGGRALNLTRASVEGAQVFNHASVQTYAHPDGASARLEVDLQPLPGGERGAVVRSGSMAFTNTVGEAYIIPVVGLLSCGDQAALAP